jgi:NCS2 family nucleobase:cation symporter-2
MAKRPSGLIYWVDEKPPAFELAMLAVQHIFLMSSTLVLPVVLVTEIGGGFDQVRAVVALTMIACGLGTIVQAMRWRGIGSGFLCPNLCGPNFFGASVEAAWLGGLPLMRGMTIAAGVVEAVFARVVHRLGFLFPPEITGLVVLMVAAGIIPLGASKFLGINYAGEPIRGMNLLAATLTLLIMVGINVWGKGKLKLYGVLIGMAFGYLVCFSLGLISSVQFHDVMAVGWIAMPQFEGMWQFSFRWSLLPAWAIVSICGALKSFGNLILCEKINDAEWSRPDIRRVGDGLMADAIAVTASGVFGGVASDTSASNVALSNATGATSRWIGFAAGGLFILLGFSPKLSAILSIMPTPVMGAIIVFVASFMIISGLQIILSAKPDTRKTFVIGVPLIFGLSLQALPELYAQVVPWLRPLFGSALTLATVLAVMLNLLLRVGSARLGEAPTISGEA